MFRPKLFGKKIEPNGIYCQHGKAAPGEQMVLCIKKGVVSPYYSCKKFLYDPLKREPRPRPPKPRFSPEDFSL